MKARAELFDALFEYKARSENELQEQGHRLTNIRLDRAGENLSTAEHEFCINHGIGSGQSPAYAKQSNSFAERLIQEHWTRARVMLFVSNLPKYLRPEAILHGNRLNNRLPASRINGNIPLKRCNPSARINYSKIFEFGAPGFAYIYRDNNTPGKKLLPRSVFGYFVGMASDTVRIKVFIPQTAKIISVRSPDFKLQDKNSLPEIEVLLDGIARQLAYEQEDTRMRTQEAHLVNALLSLRHILLQCHSLKKKSDPNLPITFEEVCQYSGWRSTIGRQSNSLPRRRTWSYVKLQPMMTPVPFTWVFKLKPLDAERKKFMERSRCCVRSDRQLAHID